MNYQKIRYVISISIRWGLGKRDHAPDTLSMVYKKLCNFFSAHSLFSRFLNLHKKSNFFPFFLKIAQNLSTVSYKGVSYKTMLSVWVGSLQNLTYK